MCDSSDSALRNFQEGEFKGPIPPLLSNRVKLQEGDNQGGSFNSFTVPENQLLQNSGEHTPQLERYKTMGGRKSEFQSAYEGYEQESDKNEKKEGKPQFLRLIIAKSLQTNFINNLWNRSYLRKMSQLTQYQIDQIDDLQLEGEGFNSNVNFTGTFAFWKLIDVFTPYSKFIVIWDVFQILTYIMIFIWLPYKISFEIYYIGQLFSFDSGKMIEIILLSILGLDVFVGLNLAFIQKEKKLQQIILINMHLLIWYYFIIIFMVSLSTVSAQFFVPALSTKDDNMILIQIVLCAIFYVLRITKINKILAQIQEFFNLNGALNELVALMKLLVTIFFIAHIIGCVWHGISYYNSDFSWLDEYHLRDRDNATRYNYSIYWATMTMTTVGYGDITAQNNIEILINNFTMFIASIVFAYVVNSIGIYVSNLYKGTMEYSRCVTLINTFMSKNKIQFDLQTRIRSYLEYIWQEEQEMNDDEVGSIVKKLSNHLQNELQFQLRGNILKSCKIIQKLFSESFVKDLLQLMEEQSYSPEERIITVNQQDDCSIYIITKGEVELLFEGKSQLNDYCKRNSIKQLKQYDSFGEVAFFTGNSRTATAISRGFTRAFKIKRESFLQLLSSYPNDYEKYCDVRDKLIYSEYSTIQLNCYSCNSNRHLVNKCHLLHFCPDEEKVIKKELFPISQRRTLSFIRRTKVKEAHALIMQLRSEIRAKDLQNDLNQQSRGTENDDQDDSHTVPLNDAYEEEEEIKSSFKEQRSQSRTFSKMSQRQQFSAEDEDQKSNPLIRKSYPPRPTVQTAGFGGRDIQKDMIWNVEQLSESSNQSEQKDQVVVPDEIQIQHHSDNNNQQKRLSFKKQHQNSSEDQQLFTKASTEVRQIESKALTSKGSKIQSEMEIKHLQSREQARKITSRTGTHNEQPTLITDNMTQINQVNLISGTTTTVVWNFDKMQIFQHYQTLNNYDAVIKRYAKAQKFFGKKRLYPEFSIYSFFFMAIKKGYKLRRLGEQAKQAHTATKLIAFKNVKKAIKRFKKPILQDDLLISIK